MFYNTGKPCKRGHLADRYTLNGTCVECTAEKKRTPHYKRLQRTYYINRPQEQKDREAARRASPEWKAYEKAYRSTPEYKARRKELDRAYRLDPKNREYRNARHRQLAYREKTRRLAGLPTPTRPEPAFCECCGSDNKGCAMSLDHDHVTGAFRGWLCNLCNTAIGKLGDNIEGLMRAIRYLERAQ